MKIFTLPFLFLLCVLPVHGQMEIESQQSAEFYIKNVLLGGGIEVANVEFVGSKGAMGQFKADSSVLGIGAGLVLSTGNVDSVVGPNDSQGYTSAGIRPADKRENRKIDRADRDLKKLSRRKLEDMVMVEFDFVPINNKLEFNYVFASEEYPEFVGSNYNDVFAFFLSGPKVKKRVNLAVLSDKETTISINNVNHINNKKYYRGDKKYFRRWVRWNRARIQKRIDKDKFVTKRNRSKLSNALHNLIQFDGLTIVLSVKYDVIPYKKYHIKIAIADAGDKAYDSAVFLEGGSFSSYADTAGTYYATLESFKGKTVDMDSILGVKEPIVKEIESPEIDPDFELTNVYFTSNSSDIPDSSFVELNKLADYLKKNKSIQCSLSGFTDNVGSKKHNQKLSEDRSIKIREFLISKGVSKSRITYQGHNFSNPRMDNSTESGRAANRRVEIILYED